MPTVDYHAVDAGGYHALIVPQCAALALGASRVKYRDLVLVVESFLRSKRERSVFRNIECVAQVILQKEAAVRKHAIVGEDPGKANDFSPDAIRYRWADNRNVGDVGSSSASACARADSAILCRRSGLREDCYIVDGASG